MIWFLVSMSVWFGVTFFREKYWSFFLFFLFLASSFRYYVGSDFDDYVVLFQHSIENRVVPVEVSYPILAKTLHYFGFNFQGQIFFYSLLTFIFLYKGLKAVSLDKAHIGVMVLFVYMVFYFPSLSIMRQALSASIVFYACYRYLIKGNVIYFVFYVFFAMFFHLSSVVYFLCIPCYFFRGSKLFSVASLFFCAILGATYFVDIVSFFASVSGFSYKGYVFSSMPIRTPVFYIFTLVLIFVYFYALKKSRKDDYFVMNIILLIILARLLAVDYKPVNRLGASFSIFIPVFVCQVFVFRMKEKSKVILFSFALSLLLVSDFFRANKDYSYYQYSVNFCVYGEPCPISIFGSLPLEKLKIREELR